MGHRKTRILPQFPWKMDEGKARWFMLDNFLHFVPQAKVTMRNICISLRAGAILDIDVVAWSTARRETIGTGKSMRRTWRIPSSCCGTPCSQASTNTGTTTIFFSSVDTTTEYGNGCYHQSCGKFPRLSMRRRHAVYLVLDYFLKEGLSGIGRWKNMRDVPWFSVDQWLQYQHG